MENSILRPKKIPCNNFNNSIEESRNKVQRWICTVQLVFFQHLQSHETYFRMLNVSITLLFQGQSRGQGQRKSYEFRSRLLWGRTFRFFQLSAPHNNLKVIRGHTKVTIIPFKTKFRQNIIKKTVSEKNRYIECKNTLTPQPPDVQLEYRFYSFKCVLKN